MESGTAMLLPEEDEMCLDSLLHQVELFVASIQETNHSFPALISEVSSADIERDGDATDGDATDGDSGSVDDDAAAADDDDDNDDGSSDLLESSVPFGSLAVDTLTRNLLLD